MYSQYSIKTSNAKTKTLPGHKNAKSYFLLLSKLSSKTEAKEQSTKGREAQEKEVLRIRLHEGAGFCVFFPAMSHSGTEKVFNLCGKDERLKKNGKIIP